MASENTAFIAAQNAGTIAATLYVATYGDSAFDPDVYNSIRTAVYEGTYELAGAQIVKENIPGTTTVAPALAGRDSEDDLWSSLIFNAEPGEVNSGKWWDMRPGHGSKFPKSKPSQPDFKQKLPQDASNEAKKAAKALWLDKAPANVKAHFGIA